MREIGSIMCLNAWAKRLVEKTRLAYHERVIRIYPDGRWETQPDRPVYEFVAKKKITGDTYNGQRGEVCIDLHKYTFPDGRVYREEVHFLDCIGGEDAPCLALQLVTPTGKEWVEKSLWTIGQNKRYWREWPARQRAKDKARLAALRDK